MKEKREVDLSQKGTLEAFELSDDDLEQVSGGGKRVITYIDENGQECSYTSALSQRSVNVD